MEKDNPTLMALLALLVGLFSVFCTVKDYDWFMQSRKARFFVNLWGRNGARAFYIVLGSFFTLAGACFLFFRDSFF